MTCGRSFDRGGTGFTRGDAGRRKGRAFWGGYFFREKRKKTGQHMHWRYLDQFVIVFVDDILIYSKSLEEHKQHLVTTLGTLRRHQLYGKLDKSEFWLTEVNFLGHVVSEAGIAVDHSKVEAVQEWQRPTNVF